MQFFYMIVHLCLACVTIGVYFVYRPITVKARRVNELTSAFNLGLAIIHGYFWVGG